MVVFICTVSCNCFLSGYFHQVAKTDKKIQKKSEHSHSSLKVLPNRSIVEICRLGHLLSKFL